MPYVQEISVMCKASLDGLLYILLAYAFNDRISESWLWTYNHVEDTWHDTRVIIDLGFCYTAHVQFILTDNRLFLAAWVKRYSKTAIGVHGNEVLERSYEISEINLESRTRNTVF